MGEYSRTLVFDGDFILFSATSGNKIFNSDGIALKDDLGRFVYTEKSIDDMYAAVDIILKETFATVGINSYIGFLGGCKSFRYDVCSGYKANRVALERPKLFDECKQYLLDQWSFNLTSNGLEADDAVNIAKNLLTKQGYEVVIVSPDKDLIKCIEGHYYNPRIRELVFTSKEEAEYNFWASVICGDTTDNIKGLKGCGPAFVKKLFNTQTNFQELVYKAYVDKLGDSGVEEYELNYNLLKILDSHNDFELPEIQVYEENVKESDAGEFSNW